MTNLHQHQECSVDSIMGRQHPLAGGMALAQTIITYTKHYYGSCWMIGYDINGWYTCIEYLLVVGLILGGIVVLSRV